MNQAKRKVSLVLNNSQEKQQPVTEVVPVAASLPVALKELKKEVKPEPVVEVQAVEVVAEPVVELQAEVAVVQSEEVTVQSNKLNSNKGKKFKKEFEPEEQV